LEKIYQVVDLHWAEICDALPTIEALSEDPNFPAADLAAAVASKCFYHLQEFNVSLRLALSAGSYFDITVRNEYIETLLSKCIDEYTELRRQQMEAASAGSSAVAVAIDPRMEAIMEQMFQRCYRDSCYQQALGIALDAHLITKVREVCEMAIQSGRTEILDHAFSLFQGARNVTSREFRLAILSTLVELYSTLPDPDMSNVCLCLQFLNRPGDVAKALYKLCLGSADQALLAYQVCFDLEEAENQGFVLKVVSSFPVPLRELSASAAAQVGAGAAPAAPAAAGDVDPAAAAASVAVQALDPVVKERLLKVKRILIEGFDVDLLLNFLFHQSRTDYKALNAIRTAIEGRTLVLHNAAVVCHGYMNCGTTVDTFLRDNLEWLKKAGIWSKFTAVGSIGVVHKGHVHESMSLLEPYLPRGEVTGSPYSEAGALYALGLIHANKGGSGDSTTISYLTSALRNAGNNEVVLHGACLALGLSAMATGDEVLFQEVKGTLFMDNAVAGEGAAFALGLIMLGQADTPLAQNAVPELLNYMHDTSHEKIIRALSLAVAMFTYGKEEAADVIIDQLTRDRDPIVRYGGMYAIAMAYCGTGDNGAVRRLLHVAVSDVSDDVKRAAVTCLGFVLCRTPEAVPRLVILLAESFNAHLRYGACMAIGVACAGTGNQEALDILLPLVKDESDFVRQGAFLSCALVLMQVSEEQNPAVKKFRDDLVDVVKDKHQTVMSKSGAIMACGIIDAGGRNLLASMHSRSGFMKMGGVVGLVMWLQYWYWYPLMHFLSLAMSPTAVIGLNKDFDLPTGFSVTCNARPSLFAYPSTEEKKEETKEKVITAILSTTAKTRARVARKEAKKVGRMGSADGSLAGGIPMERVNSSGVPLERIHSLGIPLERNPSLMSTMSHLSVMSTEVGVVTIACSYAPICMLVACLLHSSYFIFNVNGHFF
jgi:26S proteasome regulatory subunit N2